MSIHKKGEYTLENVSLTIEPLKIPDLYERRDSLEKELKEVVVEICLIDIEKDITNLIKEHELGIEVEDISWEFYPENNDEGGAYYFVEGLHINLTNNEEADEVIIQNSWGSETLTEIIRETLNEYSEDLYEYGVHNIIFRGESDVV